MQKNKHILIVIIISIFAVIIAFHFDKNVVAGNQITLSNNGRSWKLWEICYRHCAEQIRITCSSNCISDKSGKCEANCRLQLEECQYECGNKYLPESSTHSQGTN